MVGRLAENVAVVVVGRKCCGGGRFKGRGVLGGGCQGPLPYLASPNM